MLVMEGNTTEANSLTPTARRDRYWTHEGLAQVLFYFPRLLRRTLAPLLRVVQMYAAGFEEPCQEVS
jgi:hypothetical protein